MITGACRGDGHQVEEALCRAADRPAPGAAGGPEDFEHARGESADPAIASAEIASGLRRGADYVRVTLALNIVWDAFRSAARDDLKGLGGGRSRG